MTSSLMEKVVSGDQQQDSHVLEDFCTPVTSVQVGEAFQMLATQEGGAVSLGMLLRMDREFAEWLAQISADDPRRHVEVVKSARRRMEDLRWALQYAAPPGSCWRESMLEFPHIHSCAVRLPVSYMRRFLETKYFKNDSSVAAFLFNDELRVPEYWSEKNQEYDKAKQRQLGHELVRRLNGVPEGLWDGLGITRQKFSSDFWRRYKGAGQTVIVADSGQDESHPALQQQIISHEFFDQHAGHKEAKYSIDRGCHGTKIAGLIVGKQLKHGDLDLPGDGEICMGVAPEARVISLNILHGECRKERGSLIHFMAAMQWAVNNRKNPDFGGYQVINISAEALSNRISNDKTIDQLLRYVQQENLVTLLAAGNQGGKRVYLGTKGTYVAACDDFGRRLQEGSKRSHLLAPGHELPCCQPPVPDLGYHLVGIHSGSSLATAVVSGCLLRLCDATGRSAKACLKALRRTAGADGLISIDNAYQHLVCPPRKW